MDGPISRDYIVGVGVAVSMVRQGKTSHQRLCLVLIFFEK